MAHFNKNILEFTKLNFLFEAVIPSLQLQKMIVGEHSNIAADTPLKTEYFSAHFEALTWMRNELKAVT